MTTIPAGTWAIDPTHTEVGFTVRHLMSKVRGKFEQFEGVVTVAEDVTASTADVTVQLASINTGTADRDNHLRSADFFSAEENPEMTFTVTGIKPDGDDEYIASGDLTIRGVTKPIELEVEVVGVGADPWGGTRVGFEAETDISRKEWGIDFNIPVPGADKAMIGDKVSVKILGQAVLQA